jgi:hypothetical protein
MAAVRAVGDPGRRTADGENSFTQICAHAVPTTRPWRIYVRQQPHVVTGVRFRRPDDRRRCDDEPRVTDRTSRRGLARSVRVAVARRERAVTRD